MERIKYRTYETIEGEFTRCMDSINIYDEYGNIVYVAKLSNRTFCPKWFDNFISNPEEDINRIMIYQLQDGAKLMLRKYTGAKKVYMDTHVADPIFGDIIHFSLIEVGDIPTE